MIIFHLITPQTWEQVGKLPVVYEPESLFTEGFIHCSTAEQVIETANRFFGNEAELILLHLDTDKVQADIKYEPAENQLFPHIYGKLNPEAVIDVSILRKNLDGRFVS